MRNDVARVDIAGPGFQVLSSWPLPTRYRTISGTSMATPHVSGIVALTLSPMMCSKMLRREKSHGLFYRAMESGLDALNRGYRFLLIATLKAWWEPLLRMAPTLRGAVGANCLIRTDDLEILIDVPNGEVRPYAGEPYSFRFKIPRELVETAAATKAVDWSNSLLLSARFSAWRSGDFNEYLYNFLKSLSVERMRRTEAEAVRKLDPPTEVEPEIELAGYVVQRRCPHRNADLSVFGEIEAGEQGDELVCTLHGWRFDCATGRCRTAADHHLRISRRNDT